MNVLGREELLYNLEVLEKEYSEFREKDKDENVKKQETALVVRKRNPIQRFFDKIFNRGKKQEKISNTVRNNYTPEESQTTTDRHTSYRETLDPRNYSQEQISQRSAVPKQEQVIAISDLHGNMEKWNQVKSYLAANPNTKILILGDALDRGSYGVEILLQIKELCDQGKAQYLPGNHDAFAYNYVKTHDILSKLSDSQKMQNQNIISIAGRDLAHLERNHGEATLESLKNFERLVQQEIRKGNIKHNISKKELIDWLGKQPIQRKINVNNTQYALAHAWFDEELYRYDENFNMEKALQLEMYGYRDNNILNKYRTAMWYRQEDVRTHYSQVSFPKDCVMVVGHTPHEDINPNAQIIYIDTGNKKVILDMTNRKSIEEQNKSGDGR